MLETQEGRFVLKSRERLQGKEPDVAVGPWWINCQLKTLKPRDQTL